jgi:branched-chain amino acid transport system permease protein
MTAQGGMDSTAELELIDVSRHFGGVAAVSGVSIGFDRGTVTCIIGPNGAGKTTLFNLVCGAIRPDVGQVLYHGRPLEGLAVHRIARLGVGRLFQDVRVFGGMTVLDNVCVARQGHPGENVAIVPVWPLRGGSFEQDNIARARQFLRFVGLESEAQRDASRLSYGQQKLLAIARLLNNGATCLLLDEPTAGVHPSMVSCLLAVIRRLAAEGLSVVVIEHDLGIVREVGDWVYLMDQGCVEAFGTPDEMLREVALARLMPAR